MTTTEAAAFLGVNNSRIRQFIGEGRLPAIRFGKSWALDRKDVEEFARQTRPTGRPPKTPGPPNEGGA